MEIGKPTKHEGHVGRPNKYREAYDKAKALKNGDWLPVKFDTEKEAHNFWAAARQQAMHVSKRQLTVWIRPKTL